MRELFYTLLARFRAFVRAGAADEDFAQEMASHLAMAEDAYIRRGLSPDEARRQARLDLGGEAQLREAARESRGLPALESLALDARLGARMLRQSWGLTCIAGLAMAVTIGLGASIMTIWDAFAGARLPLDEGDRVVALQPFDRASQRASRSTPLADFRRWRDTLTSVEYVSATRLFQTTMTARDAGPDPVPAAEMTASAFQVARIRPLLGRTLIEQDERGGAEPVVVIASSLWQSGFSSDPAAIGQRIRVGDVDRTVVGIMPDDFRFPVSERLWVPLRTDGPAGEPPEDVFVFARLAPGATVARASAEVATLGMLPGQAADDVRREPRVVSYTAGVFPDVQASRWVTGVIFLVAALLLVPPCANVAILIYARTMARREEFAARSALGATRGRIVAQLFVEVLVLSAGSGLVAILIARQFSGRLSAIVMPSANATGAPFWVDYSPSWTAVACVTALSVLAAAIAGAVPAFHATGRWRHTGFGGGQGRDPARLGMTWTALLATQVALSLAILPSAMELTWGIFKPAIIGPRLPVEQYVTASLVMDGDTGRFATVRAEAIRQLASAGGIAGVSASATALLDEPFGRIEVEGGDASGADASVNAVDGAFFELFDVRLLGGRAFEPPDLAETDSRPVIVNKSFVDEILGHGTVLGRRLRQVRTDEDGRVTTRGSWQRIVGVAEDVLASNDGPAVYEPLAASTYPVTLTVRADGGAAVAAAVLRALPAAVDPSARVGRLQFLSERYWQRRSVYHTLGVALGTIMLIVLLFSIAGVYTLMAFIVAQRRREIGVRAALGAGPGQIVRGMFGRAMVPLTLGAATGGALAFMINDALPITVAGGARIPGVVPMSAAVVVLAGVLAVAGPSRRAIRLSPTDTLRVG